MATGIPRRVYGPMLAAYSHPRRIVADGQTGALRVPFSGLPPGCPAATHWLALLMHSWARRLQADIADAQHREYVDDLTAFREHTDPPTAVGPVLAMIAVCHDLAAQARLALNHIKSRCFSTNPRTREQLAEAGTLPCTSTWLDLGVDQAAGARPGSVKRTARTEDHATRCARIQLIPTALKWRDMLTQMAATAAGLYAVECNPVPLWQLRTCLLYTSPSPRD